MKHSLPKILAIFLIICSHSVLAEEYFGLFKNELKGTFVDADPRPLFELATNFEFEDPNGLLWSVPALKKVDGASIPSAFWSFIGGPFSGAYIKASVVHDYYCDEKIRTEHDTHRNFYYGMRANGVSEWKAKFMYWAVATFGPKWRLENRVVQNLECIDLDGRTVCSSIPKIESQVVQIHNIDLEDPNILASVLSKASAVARTLKTSNGRILDVAANGEVSSTLENISKSSENYRNVFLDGSYLHTPEKLGVLSKWDVNELDGISNWKDNKIPVYQDAVLLKNESQNLIQRGEQFKLNKEGIDLMRNQINMKSLELNMELQR